MTKKEIMKDLVEILTTFDNFCDDMYDKGSFCPRNPNDAAIDDFIEKMKIKYKLDNWKINTIIVAYERKELNNDYRRQDRNQQPHQPS